MPSAGEPSGDEDPVVSKGLPQSISVRIHQAIVLIGERQGVGLGGGVICDSGSSLRFRTERVSKMSAGEGSSPLALAC